MKSKVIRQIETTGVKEIELATMREFQSKRQANSYLLDIFKRAVNLFGEENVNRPNKDCVEVNKDATKRMIFVITR